MLSYKEYLFIRCQTMKSDIIISMKLNIARTMTIIDATIAGIDNADVPAKR